MLPMANRPMMEHVINLLRSHGFEDIVVTVAFMANAIRSYFGDGSEFGVRMVYATEATPLGTAGSVLNARDELDERFIVISGDVLTDIDLTAVVDYHDSKGALATIALKAVEDPLEFGIVITHEDGSIERFLEKPTWGEVFSDTINTGISTSSGPAGPWTSPRRSFPPFWPPASPSTAASPRATGRTWAPSRPTSRPTGTSSTRRSTSR
jgi:mannose-1-phosphate guanylyltransferase/phosphomannomutase